MAREYMDSLPDSRITTPAGEVWVCVNGPGTLHVASKPIYGNQDVSPYLTIRGIEYHASAHMVWVPEDVRAPEGQDNAGEVQVRKGWRIAPATYQRGADTVKNWRIREGLYASRKGSVGRDSVSAAATHSIVTVLEDATNAWSETPEARKAIREGVMRSHNNDARSAEEKIEELSAQIADLRAKVRAHDAEIKRLSK